MTTVVLLGTLDTKGAEYAFLRDRVIALGATPLVVDVGVREPRGVTPDVTRHEVADRAGASVERLAANGDRGEAVRAMSEGAALVLRDLHGQGEVDGVLAMGGSGGSSIAGRAMRALPVGVPKLLVSTMASGDTRAYIGATDIAMMYSVVDIAGINRLSARILTNAAAAIVGAASAKPPPTPDRRMVAATMFGVTTPAVDAARERLESAGYEVLVFHATGTGGQSMENLVTDGYLVGVLDLTTTELCDELVGGVLSAGPHRLEAAGRAGVPQVVSLGALDMVNFGPRHTVPDRFSQRDLYVHNDNVTLMRTTPEECAELGRVIAEKLNAATGPTAVFVPRRGVSLISVEGGPFHDADADEALFSALRRHLADHVELVEMDNAINDEVFARSMADRLIAFTGGSTDEAGH